MGHHFDLTRNSCQNLQIWDSTFGFDDLHQLKEAPWLLRPTLFVLIVDIAIESVPFHHQVQRHRPDLARLLRQRLLQALLSRMPDPAVPKSRPHQDQRRTDRKASRVEQVGAMVVAH